MLERGFGGNSLSWLKPSLGTVDNLAPIDAAPPNLRDEMCGRSASGRPATKTMTVASNAGNGGGSTATFFAAGLQPPTMKPSEMLALAPAAAEPIVVYTGPKKTGTELIAAVAADTDKQATPRRGKKTRVAAKKPDAAADGKDAKGDAKTAATTAATTEASRPSRPEPGTPAPSRTRQRVETRPTSAATRSGQAGASQKRRPSQRPKQAPATPSLQATRNPRQRPRT